MTHNNTIISDCYICEAFKQILTATELTSKERQEIMSYLTKLPSEDKPDPAKMANHIAAFCQQTGHENLYQQLVSIYNSLDGDGINQLVKKTGDPGEEADDESETTRLITQKSRDICLELQQLAEEAQEQNK